MYGKLAGSQTAEPDVLEKDTPSLVRMCVLLESATVIGLLLCRTANRIQSGYMNAFMPSAKEKKRLVICLFLFLIRSDFERKHIVN